MLAHHNILLLASEEKESAAIRELLRGHVVLTCAQSLRELRALLQKSDYDAVFCSWAFHAGTWSEVLDVVREESPEVPTIVLSRVGAEQEWVEALEAGAFDLLAPPFRERSLLAVLEQASASREARLWWRGASSEQPDAVSN